MGTGPGFMLLPPKAFPEMCICDVGCIQGLSFGSSSSAVVVFPVLSQLGSARHPMLGWWHLLPRVSSHPFRARQSAGTRLVHCPSAASAACAAPAAPCHSFLSRPGKHLVLSTIIASPLLAGLTDAPSHYIWPPFPEFSAGLSKLKVKKYYFLVGVRAGRAEGCRAAVAAAWHPACKPLPCRPGAKRLCCCPAAVGQALLGQEETSK